MPPDRHVRGQAKVVEALGSELMIHFVLDDAKTVNSGDPDAPEQELGEGIANAVARFSPRSKVHTDDAMNIAVNSDNLHFFDAQSRQRISNGRPTPDSSPDRYQRRSRHRLARRNGRRDYRQTCAAELRAVDLGHDVLLEAPEVVERLGNGHILERRPE